VGYRIKEATSFFNTAAVFAGLVVLMGISMILLALLRVIEKRALAWQDAKGVIRIDESA
jgi:NitT/TauT family transport system permease protein